MPFTINSLAKMNRELPVAHEVGDVDPQHHASLRLSVAAAAAADLILAFSLPALKCQQATWKTVV